MFLKLSHFYCYDAGMVSSAIANPTDVLKVRMQVASANPSASSVSLYSAFKKIYMYEGIAGLWRVSFMHTKHASTFFQD